ncbi:hypothetical protein B9Z65_1880 [Elsinoe australis]|uniref:Uncharacterized protein n=1 Tax=Elsinoe australis TaxID=40998 RepID=A0A2P7YL53_9PEZI|nr:hypothetical protein B9Z65_1880 [Elsinoe australis]
MVIAFKCEQHDDPSLDPGPVSTIEERLDLHIQQDRESLDRSNEATIRHEFQPWLREREDDDELWCKVSTSVCLEIDEESLNSILDLPEADMENFARIVQLGEARVKVMDEGWEERRAHGGDSLGWARATALSLETLYQDLQDRTPSNLFPGLRYEGQIPLYTGDPGGRFIDPPGGSQGRRIFGGTQRGPPGGRFARGETQRGA